MSSELFNLITNSIIIGVGATIVMDVWALILQRIGITSLNYALVGRWIIYMSSGRFRHNDITTAQPIKTELKIGWVAHYIIGIIFAAALILLTGNEWLNTPSVQPAILFGILTVCFPFFLMQPGMGFGIAAAKTPTPNIARLRSLMTHLIFGLGLYLSAFLKSFFNTLG
ncbi:MAG: DUF2938 domain-containing protein [Oceanospirillaceae bacterium]|nr:DUF2938 domain-containing protein [Oceanospirillaceae bacterium]